MCGLLGYIGKQDPTEFIETGLKRLEYRGYDSHGYTMYSDGIWDTVHKIGSVDKVHFKNTDNKKLKVVLAHTRWATHGAVSVSNTHPIFSSKHNTVAVVHNGTVENFFDLKAKLCTEYDFLTDTDTEAIAHLINDIEEEYYNCISSFQLETLQNHITGKNVFLFISNKNPNTINFVTQHGNLYMTPSGYIASELSVLKGFDKQYTRLFDGDYGYTNDMELEVFNKGKKIHVEWHELADAKEDYDLGNNTYYMEKEILEQPQLFATPVESFKGRKIKNLHIFACGSSYNAGILGKYYFQDIAAIPTEVSYASEFENLALFKRDETFLAISQSGETKDVMDCLYALIGIEDVRLITNNPDCEAIQHSHEFINLNCGKEIGVAATKTFTKTCLTLLEQAYLASGQSSPDYSYLADAAASFLLYSNEKVYKIAESIKNYKHMLLLANGCNYPIALEAALKLKEVSQIHAEAMPAAEVKHGPIALIDNDTLSIFIVDSNDVPLVNRVKMNMSEIRSRNGKILAIHDGILDNEPKDFEIKVPKIVGGKYLQPILNVIPLQLLSFDIAVLKKLDPDKPRNLAKSVTV